MFGDAHNRFLSGKNVVLDVYGTRELGTILNERVRIHCVVRVEARRVTNILFVRLAADCSNDTHYATTVPRSNLNHIQNERKKEYKKCNEVFSERVNIDFETFLDNHREKECNF